MDIQVKLVINGIVQKEGLKLESLTNALNLSIQNIDNNRVINTLVLEIDFGQPILKWRNFDYQWADCNNHRRLIANYYSPKIVQLNDGQFIVANKTLGCWEFESNHPNQLNWVIYHPDLNPIIQYDGQDRRVFQANKLSSYAIDLKLLLTKGSVEEWSRSPIPFSATVCFTDHCDYDSLLLLKKQRQFFKDNGIKVTKGFFQYHHSKRDFNTSFDKPEEVLEYQAWVQDGHELAYHSLSQTKKEGDLPFRDFENFGNHAFSLTTTWIDHGYQPYNFTLVERTNRISVSDWIQFIKLKGVNVLWSYVDSGESNSGIINQINPNHFSLDQILKLQIPTSEKIRLYLFYFTDENTLVSYRKLSAELKRFIKNKSLSALGSFVKHGLTLSKKIIPLITKMGLDKNRIPHFAKYGPTIFKIYQNTPSEVSVFQTVAVKDYAKTFSDNNLATLIGESGVCIAHTYFAFLEDHHAGRLFKDENGEVLPQNNLCFKTLGQLIIENKIWNPVFKEMVEYYNQFEKLEYILDDYNNIILNLETINNIPKRTIN